MRALVLLTVCLLAAPSLAAPLLVNYQGQLLDGAGLPLTGVVSLSLDIWNDPVSVVPGDRLYGETHAAVSVQDGVFSVSLGGGTPTTGSFDAALFAEPQLWLEVTVDGDTLAPRERLVAVPYAIRSETTENVEGLPAQMVEDYFDNTNFDNQVPNNTHPDEGVADPDGDGVLNYLDPDNDDDGLSDSVEVSQGSNLNLVTPTLTSTDPNFADAAQTSVVTIHGTNFSAGLGVSFGSESPAPQNLTQTSFDVSVGPQAPGVVNVDVTLPNGESDGATFQFGSARVVFITSTTYDGNFGGLAGADAQCAARASAASLPGTFLAWLGDKNGDPDSRFDKTGGPFVRVTGVIIAEDWAELTDGFLTLPPATTEFGTAVVLNEKAWTDVENDGTTVSGDDVQDCLSWTSNSVGQVGRTANPLSTVQWTVEGTRNCFGANHLYCFEQ